MDQLLSLFSLYFYPLFTSLTHAFHLHNSALGDTGYRLQRYNEVNTDLTSSNVTSDHGAANCSSETTELES